MKLFLTALLLAFFLPSPQSPPSPQILTSDTTIILDGSQSLYADTYHWRQIDGIAVTLAAPDSAKCQALNLTEGKYEFELTCTNQYGEDKDSVVITVIKGVLSLPDTIEHTWRRPGAITELSITLSQKGNQILAEIKSPRTQFIDCIIYDASGRAIAKARVHVMKGINHIALPKPKIPGMYFLRFQSYFDKITQKLII